MYNKAIELTRREPVCRSFRQCLYSCSEAIAARQLIAGPLCIMSDNQMQIRDRRFLGVILLGVGLFIASVSVNILRVDESTIHAPRWVIFLVAMVFASAGVLAIVGQNSRVSDLIAAIILFLMSAIGAWVSLFGSSAEFSGGSAILPQDANVAVARALFGFGALITLAMSAYALKRGFKQDA